MSLISETFETKIGGGGGSAGCNTLYELTKRGVNALLLERSQLTSGTTWHTAGLVWRLRPNDTEIQILADTRHRLMSLEEETGLNSGWINNGGIFIAHSKERLDEYRRLSTIGRCMNVESEILDPSETQKLFPLLDPESFYGALYSPGDGVVDPAMMCAALTRAAGHKGGKFIENCPITKILVGETLLGEKEVVGIETEHGTIKTNCIINAAGVWSGHLLEELGLSLPLIPMKHAYIVSEPMGAQGLPNIRDHDASVYFRIQGESICMGGYETDPILLGKVPPDFSFGLYELDWSVFEAHTSWAGKICPAFDQAGIKSTVCGPESFTPDHKPIMGPDPRLHGLFHNCGYNSAGMMLGAGCAKQMAKWVINGRPDFDMFAYDIRRFSPKQMNDTKWATEKSHESYVKNYSIVFPHDESLAGRNLHLDPLHDEMLAYHAVMEERHGWERPGYFLEDKVKSPDAKTAAPVTTYDWYGSYGHQKSPDQRYVEKLKGEYRFGFPECHDIIASEAMACRKQAALFNMSYFCKLYLTGPDAQQASDYIFTANTNKPTNKTVYTCALNQNGGVEADVTISAIDPGVGNITDPIFKGRGFYIVAGGASAYHTYVHIKSILREKNFKCHIRDVTDQMGVLSIQGPNSREILKQMTNANLSDEALPPNSTTMLTIKDGLSKSYVCRALRVSFVGELGYELHMRNEDCVPIFRALMDVGKSKGLRNAGYRALYSLSSEKGYHLWHSDLRPDDTPIEAGLAFTCRKTGDYIGKAAIDEQRKNGIRRKLAFFTMDAQVPIWGLEGVWRNGEIGVIFDAASMVTRYANQLAKLTFLVLMEALLMQIFSKLEISNRGNGKTI
ncbi:sarcosine dehydrogenase, mitochondrial-like [Ctenocephalides felis]|uniref:sarcosine dehydrogenase, mitochondrial-like n=1 Tax=Ctenocephalides felis TaxID=7515 RepID=UPI000E6E13A4|nr:sarcosine dehydrogenase, mitochondrial-like [Ctenocephalides felis]